MVTFNFIFIYKIVLKNAKEGNAPIYPFVTSSSFPILSPIVRLCIVYFTYCGIELNN